MKFHKQEHLWNSSDIIPRGSCYPTVLACLLDLELHDVPYFHLCYFTSEIETNNLRTYFQNRYLEGKTLEQAKEAGLPDHKISNYQDTFFNAKHWIWDNVRQFWLASKGYFESYIGDIDKFINENPDSPYMVSAKSSRGIYHVVIYKNGQLFHDPHPSNEGVLPESSDNKYTYTYLERIENYSQFDKYYKKLEE